MLGRLVGAMSVVQHAAGSVLALPIERQVLLECVRM